MQHGFTVSGLVGPGAEPAAESARQIGLRWRDCAALADNFVDEGFDVVVDTAASRRSSVELFASFLRTRPWSLVVLAPRMEVALERDRLRPDKQVAHLFAHMDAELREDLAGVGWWVDTSDRTVDETVQAILDEGLAAGERG